MKTGKKEATGSASKARKSGGPSKQKVQLTVLGGLSLLLVVVVVMQTGGSETEYEVAALAADAMIAPEAEVESDVVVAEEETRALDNPVLSQPPPEGGLTRNPFENFWNRDETGPEAVQRLPPPQIALGMTLPGTMRPLAVIDGQMRFVGEIIQGWTLAEIRPRAVVLQSPAEERLVVEMPLHLRSIAVPPGNVP
ncbi:MAG: hypothetical protein ACYTG2_02190 [Planctomycetota bacterium]